MRSLRSIRLFPKVLIPTGKIILTNPFVTGNADAAVKVEEITKADLILVPNGHRDEIGDTIALAKNTGALTLAEVRAALDSIGIRIPITDPVRKQVYEFKKQKPGTWRALKA
jgi:L-ascorbate metabolism protein UlaG (beta-lactamase superfamily)